MRFVWALASGIVRFVCSIWDIFFVSPFLQDRTEWTSRDHWLWIREPSADPQCSVHQLRHLTSLWRNIVLNIILIIKKVWGQLDLYIAIHFISYTVCYCMSALYSWCCSYQFVVFHRFSHHHHLLLMWIWTAWHVYVWFLSFCCKVLTEWPECKDFKQTRLICLTEKYLLWFQTTDVEQSDRSTDV